MPYPTIYDVTYSYTGFQQSQGDNTFPGTQLDSDLRGLEDTSNSLFEFMKTVIRSDGALNNGIVTFDSLSPSLQTAGLAPAALWVTGVNYAQGANIVVNGSLYRSAVAHLSNVFATDLAAGKWIFVLTLPVGGGDLLAVNNLSELASRSTAQKNLGVREVLTATRNVFVGTTAVDVSVSIASPGVVAWPAHGLQANDPVVLSIVPKTASVTITIATPGIVSWPAHGFLADQPFKFSTTDNALPTGAVAGVTYFVIASGLTADTFRFSATVGGSAINTTGAQSGSHFGERTGTMPTGLVEGTVYYAKTVIDSGHITLSATPGGAAINTTGSTAGKISAFTGNDSNAGSTPAGRTGPFLTVQHAWNVVRDTLDKDGQDVNIWLANGKHAGVINILYPGQGVGTVKIIGDVVTPSNVTITTTSDCFLVEPFTGVYFDGIKMTSSGGGGVTAAPYSSVDYGRVEFGQVVNKHTDGGGQHRFNTGYLISGGGVAHWHGGGQVPNGAIPVTLTNLPSFSAYFCGIAYASMQTAGFFFIGQASATTVKYLAHKNGTIDDGGGAENRFPGGLPGRVATGGKYAGAITPADAAVLPQGRLTLTSGLSVTTSDVSAAGIVYYTPHNGSSVPIFDGTSFTNYQFSEVDNWAANVAQGNGGPAAVAASSVYDLYVYLNLTTGILQMARSQAWFSDNIRGGGAAQVNQNGTASGPGIKLNALDIVNGPKASRGTWVGTVRSDASGLFNFTFGSAASGGGQALLHVWNAYNRVPVIATVSDSAATWTYSAFAWRAVHNSVTNRISAVFGANEDSVDVDYGVYVNCGAGNTQLSIGYDAASPSAAPNSLQVVAIGSATPRAAWSGKSGLGVHFWQPVEIADGSNSVTYNGGATMRLAGKFTM